MIPVTIAVPVALISAANHLARVIGYSEADGETFSLAPVVGGYAVASGLVAPAFVSDAFQPLIEPEWGADMVAAAEAQAEVVLIEPPVADDPPPEIPEGKILAVVGLDPPAARALLGLGEPLAPVELEPEA
ncbi:hypothetical protein [Falsigemmobacter faecalis]|uniref:Uncharacterized protein n=1 Tax=Falsigemmobacter faecalis TaxID=2488730 RepID=A0A3P3DCC7_9RHOB|nr:hypothetical protein [Falsigemmobacter faecalis]RRH71276.1 hypothetical protein EG244_16500 [Falsigemmobacter faecalis]